MRAPRRVLQVAALLVVLVAVPSPLFDLDRFQVPKELVLHVAAFGAATLALGGVRRIPLATTDLLLIGFGVLTALSTITAPNPWLAVRATGVTWAGLALFWVARALARGGLARPLLAVVAAASVAGAGTALLQAYGVELPLASSRRMPGGAFGNRNFMAHATAIALPVIIYLAIESRARAAPVLGAVAIAISSAALLLSRSRAAWLAVAAGLTILLVEGIGVSGLWRDPAIRRRLITLAASAALAITAALAVPNALSWRSDMPYLETLVGVANYREGSGRGRLIQYENTLRMVRDAPLLGVGAGNWAVEYPRYTTPGDPAFDATDPIPTNPWPSSDWVGIVAERGVPALLLLVAAGAAMAIVGWRRSRQKGRSPEGLAGLAMIATIVVTVVAGAFDAVMLLATPTFFAWTILGALHPPPREQLAIQRPALIAKLRAGALGAGLLFGLLAAAQTVSIALAGDGSSLRRVRWAAAVDPGSFRLDLHLAGRSRGCAARIPYAQRAHALYPNHAEPRRMLRRCGVPMPPLRRAPR